MEKKALSSTTGQPEGRALFHYPLYCSRLATTPVNTHMIGYCHFNSPVVDSSEVQCGCGFDSQGGGHSCWTLLVWFSVYPVMLRNAVLKAVYIAVHRVAVVYVGSQT